MLPSSSHFANIKLKLFFGGKQVFKCRERLWSECDRGHDNPLSKISMVKGYGAEAPVQERAT